MTTQKIEVAHEPLVKQKFNWLLAIGIFIMGLGLGAFVTTLPIAKTEISEQNAVGPIVRDFPARPDLAELEKGAIEAEAARPGLVDEVKDGPGALTWPPRPTQLHITENVGVSLDEDALALYHQSEWSRTPSTVVPMAEDPLAKYHQSEWGRALNPILPIVENKANADQDIGLMEVFTLVSGAGLPRHDREYGLAAFSTVPAEVTEADPLRAVNETGLARYHESEWGFAPNKADADGDMGLMEFFATPNETSRERTDPGALETLPNIDPADRKFFNLGYGATSGVSEEAEVLPTVDPADRKFFNLGYGAQTTGAQPSEAIPASIDNEMGEWSAIWFLLK